MEFKLPDIGEGVHEGEITRWLVKEGETIEVDQPMVEVMTDKATVEIPSPVKGVVSQLLVKEGETIEVGKTILRIQEKGNGKSAPQAEAARAKAPHAPEAKEAPKKAAHAEEDISEEPATEAEIVPFQVLATPATRKLARDLKVDLRNVSGTGPHGRVTKEDVRLNYEGKEAAHPRPSHTAVATQSTKSTPNVPARRPAVPVTPTAGVVERVPLRGIRKRIAEGMARSKHTAAHFTFVEEVDMSEIVKLREAGKPEAEMRAVKLTFLPFIIKALIPALREFPYLNSSLDDEKQEILLKGDYNIGIATDTPQGLMVPVVKAADRKSIWEIAQDIQELSERARNGKSSIDDLRGGTFTVTNAGNIGGVFATPVINHPEVAILGVNSIRKRPVVKNDEITIADMMFLSLSVDHRVVDGADAARFMNRLIYFLSDPKRFVFA